jgi:UDP-glucose 4-epimerase
MRIFITGIAGFLGANLADHFLKNGHVVAGNDNLVGGLLSNVPKSVRFYNLSCEDLDGMRKAIEGSDAVIHCAAYAHEGLSVFSPFAITSNIVSGSVSVFSAAISCNVKRIVFCSSTARYGSIKTPFKESDRPMPQDPYGIAKLAAEDILKNLAHTHNFEYNIVVPHNIIGIKQRYDDPYRNVASIMVNLMLQNREPIIYGDGNQKRSFSDVRDCIHSIDKVTLDKNIKNETINIGPGEDENFITINNLFEEISNKLNFNKKPIYYPDRPQEVKISTCSSEKSRRLLNYKTKYTVSQSLDSIIDYIKISGVKEFSYDYDIEIKNEKTPETWLKKIF